MSEREKLLSIVESSRDGIHYSVPGSQTGYVLSKRPEVIGALMDLVRRLENSSFPFGEGGAHRNRIVFVAMGEEGPKDEHVLADAKRVLELEHGIEIDFGFYLSEEQAEIRLPRTKEQNRQIYEENHVHMIYKGPRFRIATTTGLPLQTLINALKVAPRTTIPMLVALFKTSRSDQQ